MDSRTAMEPEPKYPSKKCPECYTYIPINAKVCPSCKIRVGKVTRSGMAARATNWKANIICIIAWLVFALYIRYAFF